MFVKFQYMVLVLSLALVATAHAADFAPVKFEEVDAGMPYNAAPIPAADPHELEGVKVAFVAAHGFEEIELVYPYQHLLARGATIEVISPDWIKDRVMAVQFLKPSVWVPVTKNISQAKATDYHAVIVPGGAWNPIIMRTDGAILDFLKQADAAGILIASLCHGPQVLLNAGLVKGRRVTGVGDFRQDLRNAGATVIEDQPVVVDGHLLTSRDPNDVAQFAQAIERTLAASAKRAVRYGRLDP